MTLYLLVLGVLGYILAYLESKEPVAFTPLILLVLAPLFTGGGLVVAGTLAYGGGIAWKFLTEREWRFEELGSITLIVIACSVLFTGIVTVRERADIDEDRIALRTFVREGIGEGERVALDAPVAGALAMEGIATGEPTIPSDGSFVAGALANEGYAYIVSDHPRPHYRHFPVVFTTDSPTTYTIYEVPRR